MPVPEDFLITELWYCKTLGRSKVFQEILKRIQATPVYSNMAMVQRLCPAMALTPINALQSDGSGPLKTEGTAIGLMQTTQWLYERGMQELQDAAVEYFHDIPVQIGTWDWSEKWSYPVINCRATYLTFNVPSSDKGCVRPVRDAPTVITYEKCVVMPYHESGLETIEEDRHSGRTSAIRQDELKTVRWKSAPGKDNLNIRILLNGCKIWQKMKLGKVSLQARVSLDLRSHSHSRHSHPNSKLMKKEEWC